MDMQKRKKVNSCVIMFLFMVLIACFVGFYKTTSFSSAEIAQANTVTFLPQSSLENTALEKASAVYRDENLTAIIEDSYKFTIHFADRSVVVNDDKNNLKDMLDVKLFNQNTLFFTANARLYAYDLTQGTYEKVMIDGKDDEPVSYFDFNDNYLITTYQSTCKIFSIVNGSFLRYGSEINIYNGSNISINSDNQLFIVGSSGIYKTFANEPAVQTPSNTLINTTPSQIISNNDFVYYVLNDKVYSLSVNGGSPVELTTLESDKNYDLGTISSSIKFITF